MSDTILCPKCNSEFTYPQDNLMVCSQCFHEWDPADISADSDDKVFDSNGNELQDGDSVVVVKEGMRVVDACAGAGGKTLHIAALMKNKGQIIALDIFEWKLAELKRRAKRAGAHNIETRVIDDNKVIKRLHNSADRLLIDAPCSGLGVLKRNPDSKWKIDQDFIDRIKKEQENILQDYSKIIKKGGQMVYATCSILPSENTLQTKNFIEKNPEYELIGEEKIMPSHGYDGFYMALIQRKA